MEFNEVIKIIVIGIMFMYAYWLSVLSYLVIKRHRHNEVEYGKESIKTGDKYEFQTKQSE
jgi:hypothetical protein